MSSATPSFVRWTLARSCQLREQTDIADAEQTQRQLHVLRTYRDALAEGRCLDGVCAAKFDEGPLLGFVEREVLAAYGGEPLIASECRHCLANIYGEESEAFAAGCFGLFTFEPQAAAWEAAIERGLTDSFLTTQPRWFGLWAESPLRPDQLESLYHIVTDAALVAVDADGSIRQFAQAIRLALANNIALHCRAYPAGEVTPLAWTIDAHCPRCRATMEAHERRCRTCGLATHPEPSRRRKPRGNRPYVPITRFLGETGAAVFAARWQQQRK